MDHRRLAGYGVEVPVVVEGRRRQKVANAEYITGTFQIQSFRRPFFGTHFRYVTMGISTGTQIEVELENEPIESAVSSPCDHTHHG